MGKSTVAGYLSRIGEWVVDTDVLAREMVAPGQPALDEIAGTFGKEVLTANGSLDRAALAEIVFKDDSRRKVLESILHPRIRAAWQEWAENCSARGAHRAFVVIPLLFETAAEKELDLTICVACSTELQARRLGVRGWDKEEITRRIAAQMPIREKMDRAHRIVWNEAGLDVCEQQVARILASL